MTIDNTPPFWYSKTTKTFHWGTYIMNNEFNGDTFIINTTGSIKDVKKQMQKEFKANKTINFKIEPTVEFNNLNELLDFFTHTQRLGVTTTIKDMEWLTDEVVAGLMSIKKKAFSNKVKAGMQNTVNKNGRPSSSKDDEKLIGMYLSNQYTGQQIADECGVSRNTVYRVLKKHGVEV